MFFSSNFLFLFSYFGIDYLFISMFCCTLYMYTYLALSDNRKSIIERKITMTMFRTCIRKYEIRYDKYSTFLTIIISTFIQFTTKNRVNGKQGKLIC